jgi:hypothetical protein
MPQLFISHSSSNNAEALALAQWLTANGWTEFFLDISTDRHQGISAGDRWQDALARANRRCEAVLCLLTPEWRDSIYCRTELQVAKNLGKRLFGIVVAELSFEGLSSSIMAEWQLCDLLHGEPRTEFRVQADRAAPSRTVTFPTQGLAQLKSGLQNAGLEPHRFAWPPDGEPGRHPYRSSAARCRRCCRVLRARVRDSDWG